MPTIQIYSNNFSGQTGYLIFYPQTGGTINIGTVTLPYNYNTDYYYGTFVINFSGFSRTCNLQILAPSPTPTVTPTITPSSTQPPSCDVLVGFITPTPTPSITQTITPTITLTPTMTKTPDNTPTPTPTPNPSTGCNCYQFLSVGTNGLVTYMDCSGTTKPQFLPGNTPISLCVSGRSSTGSTNVITSYLGSCSSGSCPTTFSINESDPLLLTLTTNQYKIYSWNVSLNDYRWLDVPNPVTGITAISIAHTSNKLWVASSSTVNTVGLIREWDITLSPFTATYNRDIIPPIPMKLGLFAMDDTTLIGTTGGAGNYIVSLDVSNPTPVISPLFSLSGYIMSQDLLVTTTNKLIATVTSTGGVSPRINQYNFITGVLELSVPLPFSADSPLIYNNGIYIKTTTSLYYIPNTNPYSPVVNTNRPSPQTQQLSQILSYVNTSFII